MNPVEESLADEYRDQAEEAARERAEAADIPDEGPDDPEPPPTLEEMQQRIEEMVRGTFEPMIGGGVPPDFSPVLVEDERNKQIAQTIEILNVTLDNLCSRLEDVLKNGARGSYGPDTLLTAIRELTLAIDRIRT